MDRLVLPLMMFGKHRKKVYTPGLDQGLYPSANHIYMNTRHGRKLAPIAEQKLEQWRWLASVWAKENRWQITCNQKVIIRLYFFLNDRRKKDTHNTKKLLLDAMQGVIYDDDYYVLDQTIDFEIDRTNPRIEIEVEVK